MQTILLSLSWEMWLLIIFIAIALIMVGICIGVWISYKYYSKVIKPVNNEQQGWASMDDINGLFHDDEIDFINQH